MSFLFDLPFVIRLAAWFGAFLSAFHAYFAVCEGLTIVSVRKLDYWYIGFAALGLIFVTSTYADSRAEYVAHFEVERARSRLASAETALRARIHTYRDSTCQYAENMGLRYCATDKSKFRDGLFKLSCANQYQIDRILEHCDNVAEPLKVWAESEHSIAELRTKIGSLQELADRDQSQHPFIEDDPEPKPLFWPYSWTWSGPRQIISRIKDQVSRAEELEVAIGRTNMAPKEWRALDVYYGIGHTVLWPFIFAIALALRLTKVTIEVGQWYER